MKKTFILFLLVVFFTSCIKEVLDNSDSKKLRGTWRIREVKVVSGNGNFTGVDFREGEFTFIKDGTLQFRNASGEMYTGTWLLDNKKEQTDCYIAPDGNTVCADTWNTTLYLNAKTANGQQKKAAYFEYLSFSGNTNLKATFRTTPVHSYEYRLEKK